MAKARLSLKTSDFKILSTIGSGSYGTCKKVLRIHDNMIFVWKEMDYSSASEADKIALVSEVNVLRELKHEYIVRYIDRIIDKKISTLYLIMEYCEGGDLAAYITKIKKEGGRIDELYIWQVCYQLTLALKVCHSIQKNGHSVLHRDLKPANIFLDSNMNVKLGDFGLARILNHESSFARTCVGTPLYMSPEQMSGEAYNTKSDVWALGCLLYELASLSPPFCASSQIDLAKKICIGHFPRIPSYYSIELNILICQLLIKDPKCRPSIDQLLTNTTLLLINGILPSQQPFCKSINPIGVESYTKEIARLNEELNKKIDEITVLKIEINAKNLDYEKKIDELNECIKKCDILERKAQDKLNSHNNNSPSKPPKHPGKKLGRTKTSACVLRPHADISPGIPKLNPHTSKTLCSVDTDNEAIRIPIARKRSLSNPKIVIQDVEIRGPKSACIERSFLKYSGTNKKSGSKSNSKDKENLHKIVLVGDYKEKSNKGYIKLITNCLSPRNLLPKLKNDVRSPQTHISQDKKKDIYCDKNVDINNNNNNNILIQCINNQLNQNPNNSINEQNENYQKFTYKIENYLKQGENFKPNAIAVNTISPLRALQQFQYNSK